MVDFQRTLALIKGAIFDPEPTWRGYLADASDWQKTAWLLTGPLVIGSSVLSFVLRVIFPPMWMGRPGLGGLIVSLVAGALGAVVVAFVVAILAGMFKGRNSFPHALAATSLAFVPGYAGNVLGGLPWIGFVLSLGLGIYSLVLLWRILPLYMEVPETARVGHYILSLVVSVVAFAVVGMAIGGGGMRGMMTDTVETSGRMASDERPTGLFGQMERHSRIMEAASEDRYEPPRDGKLTEAQVRRYAEVLKKTRAYRSAQADKLKALSEKAEGKGIESLGEIMSGVSGVVSVTTAEMEVVKTAGGNWAEHQWVKEQLHVAQLQQDINEAVKHNYALYREYAEQIESAD